MIIRILLTLCLCCLVFSVHAQEATAEDEKNQEEQASSGEVIIKGSGSDMINEFRINGQLYMIRITPKKGSPYYLVDSDGDGNLETRWSELAPNLLIPSWVLLRW